MSRLILTALILSTIVRIESAHAEAAIAFSPNPDGTWFVFADWNRGQRLTAETRALEGCRLKGGAACRIIHTAQNRCHSVAITNEGQFAIGSGNSQRQAQDRSVVACLVLEPGGSCVVRKSFCDNTDGFVPVDADPLRPINPGPSQFFCRSPGDYNRCMSAAQGPPQSAGRPNGSATAGWPSAEVS